MPETINPTDSPYFMFGSSFADLAQLATGVTYTISDDPFGEVELLDMALPELKLTRQHARRFDCEEEDIRASGSLRL